VHLRFVELLADDGHNINPHPFVPAHKSGGGEEAEKQGELGRKPEAIPCFSEELVLIGFNKRTNGLSFSKLNRPPRPTFSIDLPEKSVHFHKESTTNKYTALIGVIPDAPCEC
jgi:hypothetical protein